MKHILILDDSPTLLAVARSALEAAGYIVTTAVDLATLEHARARVAADLILLDVQMPEAMGDDVGAVLRDVRGERAPIFLYSSLPPAELDSRAAEAGVDGWISKRDGVDVMVARVADALREGTRR